MTRRLLAMLLAALMMVSALPVYAAGDEAPAQDDPWMDYAQEHLGNTLPFMREEELSFLEPGCQVYLGKRLSIYNPQQVGELDYAMYPVFADGNVVAIATITEDENGDLNFEVGPTFANELNKFITDNPSIALVVDGNSIQAINDRGEVKVLSSLQPVIFPVFYSLTADMNFTQVIPVCAVQEVPQSKAVGEDSGTVRVQYVPQNGLPLCWASCMASIVNYFNGTSYSATSLADYLGVKYEGQKSTDCRQWYKNKFGLNCSLVLKALSYDYVYNQAYNGKPLDVELLGTDDSGQNRGHGVVVRGCYISNSVVYYRIMDPNHGFRSVQMRSDGKFVLKVSGITLVQYRYIEFV